MTDKFDLIHRIINRAEPIARANHLILDRLTSMMDIDNADKQYPLDLEAMLAADATNFNHDFFGIRAHMNRETGKLEDNRATLPQGEGGDMIYVALDPRFHPEQLGFLTGFLDEDDPRSAVEQLDANYQHGGGWRPMPGFKLNHATMSLTYPGDPPLKPFVMTVLHDVEAIYFYPYEQVLILQQDGSFEVARMS